MGVGKVRFFFFLDGGGVRRRMMRVGREMWPDGKLRGGVNNAEMSGAGGDVVGMGANERASY